MNSTGTKQKIAVLAGAMTVALLGSLLVTRNGGKSSLVLQTLPSSSDRTLQ